MHENWHRAQLIPWEVDVRDACAEDDKDIRTFLHIEGEVVFSEYVIVRRDNQVFPLRKDVFDAHYKVLDEKRDDVINKGMAVARDMMRIQW